MCSMKRTFTREELLIEIEATVGVACGLCKERGVNEVHTADCLLSNPNVLGVMVTTLSKPNKAICEACNGKKYCKLFLGDAGETHESLMLTCGRYAVDYGRQ